MSSSQGSAEVSAAISAREFVSLGVREVISTGRCSISPPASPAIRPQKIATNSQNSPLSPPNGPNNQPNNTNNQPNNSPETSPTYSLRSKAPSCCLVDGQTRATCVMAAS